MYATVTDWETEAPTIPESFCKQVEIAFQDFKSVGVINHHVAKTSDCTARNMTLQQDEKTAKFAIEAIEAVKNSLTGVKFLTSVKRPVIFDLNQYNA